MNCKEGNQVIIRQITNLLDALAPAEYAQSLDVFNGISIGQHIRHILDFYICLMQGIEAGTIDYADRARNPLAETDPAYTSDAFQKIISQVEHLSETTQIEVWGDFSRTHNQQRPLLQSSVGRELMFAHDHAVHHLAIIKIGIQQAFPEISLDSTFGVAPSTVKHHAVTADGHA